MAQRRIPQPTSAGRDPSTDELFRNPAGKDGIYINLQPLGGTLKGTYTNLTMTKLAAAYTLRTGRFQSMVSTSTIVRWYPSNNAVLSLNSLSAHVEHATATNDIVGLNFRVPSTSLRVSPRVGTAYVVRGNDVYPDGYAVTPSSPVVRANRSFDQNQDFDIYHTLLPPAENRIAVDGSRANIFPATGGSQKFSVGGTAPGSVRGFEFYLDFNEVQFGTV